MPASKKSIKDSAFAACEDGFLAGFLQRWFSPACQHWLDAEIGMMIKLVTFRSALRLNG
jgi:hypothetical protein